MSHGIMFSIRIPVEDLQLKRAVLVAIAQHVHGDLDGAPDGIQGIVDPLTLPDYSVRSIFIQSIVR